MSIVGKYRVLGLGDLKWLQECPERRKNKNVYACFKELFLVLVVEFSVNVCVHLYIEKPMQISGKLVLMIKDQFLTPVNRWQYSYHGSVNILMRKVNKFIHL